jgi:AraC-like DNA-binding protein
MHLSTSVSAIGARWALWDAAHFSRLFKSTFGASPRAYRQAALDGRLESAGLRASA